ncbi:MAG: YkgJ family cysteine cluster protein [Pirellulaceae bacterium]
MPKPDKDKKKSKKKKKADEKANKGPWYRDGLAFECTQCGQCCSGDPGYVWVNEEEIAAMAGDLKMEVDSFEDRFIRQVGSERSLLEYPDGDCILLDPDTRKCSVYQSRPIQCRTWPFWDSTLDKKKSWKETCEICPGAGTGRIYTFEEIEIERLKKSV